MPKFEAKFVRTIKIEKTITIEAASQREAEDKAELESYKIRLDEPVVHDDTDIDSVCEVDE